MGTNMPKYGQKWAKKPWISSSDLYAVTRGWMLLLFHLGRVTMTGSSSSSSVPCYNVVKQVTYIIML